MENMENMNEKERIVIVPEEPVGATGTWTVLPIKKETSIDVFSEPNLLLKLQDIGVLLGNNTTIRITKTFLQRISQTCKQFKPHRTIRKPEKAVIKIEETVSEESSLTHTITSDLKRSRTGRILKPKRIVSPEIVQKRRKVKKKIASCGSDSSDDFAAPRKSKKCIRRLVSSDSDTSEHSEMPTTSKTGSVGNPDHLSTSLNEMNPQKIPVSVECVAAEEEPVKKDVPEKSVDKLTNRLINRVRAAFEKGHSERLVKIKEAEKRAMDRNDYQIMEAGDEIGLVEIEIETEESLAEKQEKSLFKKPKPPGNLEVGPMKACYKIEKKEKSRPGCSNQSQKPVQDDLITVSSEERVNPTVSNINSFLNSPPVKALSVPNNEVMNSVKEVVKVSVPEPSVPHCEQVTVRPNNPFLLFEIGPTLIVGNFYITSLEGYPLQLMRYNGISFDPFGVAELNALVNECKENVAQTMNTSGGSKITCNSTNQE